MIHEADRRGGLSGDAVEPLGEGRTALRNGFYASTIPRLLGHALDTGELVAPADGPAAFDLEGIAGMLSEVTGETIRRVVADDDKSLSGLLQRGVPEHQAQMLLGMFLAARRGEFATVSPALQETLGREPDPVSSVLEERPALR